MIKVAVFDTSNYDTLKDAELHGALYMTALKGDLRLNTTALSEALCNFVSIAELAMGCIGLPNGLTLLVEHPVSHEFIPVDDLDTYSHNLSVMIESIVPIL
jgi:hypothetical protein